jgi:hypothetical protein
MYDLYDTNFQSNGEFCKIDILYSNIDNLSTVDHFTVALAVKKWHVLVLDNYYAHSLSFYC